MGNDSELQWQVVMFKGLPGATVTFGQLLLSATTVVQVCANCQGKAVGVAAVWGSSCGTIHDWVFWYDLTNFILSNVPLTGNLIRLKVLQRV